MSDSKRVTVYQFKIFILGISPTIWQRIKVRSDNTIAALHYIIQTETYRSLAVSNRQLKLVVVSS